MTLADYDEVIALWRICEGIGLSSSDERAAIHTYLVPTSFAVWTFGAAAPVGTDRRAVREHSYGAPSRLKTAGIPKCNLFLYAHNQAGRDFRLQHGWATRDDLVLLQKTLESTPPLTR
jgi:hypothetical protein